MQLFSAFQAGDISLPAFLAMSGLLPALQALPTAELDQPTRQTGYRARLEDVSCRRLTTTVGTPCTNESRIDCTEESWSWSGRQSNSRHCRVWIDGQHRLYFWLYAVGVVIVESKLSR